MIRFIYVVLLVVLISCGDESEFMIQPEMQGYYNDFLDEASARGVVIKNNNLILTIRENVRAEYGGNAATRLTKDQTYIYIDADWFKKRGELIEMTVFHELGHAKLKRDHNNTFSLMNSNVSGVMDWNNCTPDVSCKKELIDELFNPK